MTEYYITLIDKKRKRSLLSEERGLKTVFFKMYLVGMT